MKKCRICGEIVEDSAKYCPKCGVELENYSETLEGEVIETPKENVNVALEHNRLRDEYSKRANTSFVLSIVSIVLCCCTITSIISLILSITLMIDMNKMSDEVKNSEEYRKIKSKNLAALIISAVLVAIGIFNGIDYLVNADEYMEMYNSMYQEILNSANYYG